MHTYFPKRYCMKLVFPHLKKKIPPTLGVSDYLPLRSSTLISLLCSLNITPPHSTHPLLGHLSPHCIEFSAYYLQIA